MISSTIWIFQRNKKETISFIENPVETGNDNDRRRKMGYNYWIDIQKKHTIQWKNDAKRGEKYKNKIELHCTHARWGEIRTVTLHENK